MNIHEMPTKIADAQKLVFDTAIELSRGIPLTSEFYSIRCDVRKENICMKIKIFGDLVPELYYRDYQPPEEINGFDVIFTIAGNLSWPSNKSEEDIKTQNLYNKLITEKQRLEDDIEIEKACSCLLGDENEL